MDERRKTTNEESDGRGRNFLIGFGLLAAALIFVLWIGGTGHGFLDLPIVAVLLFGAIAFVGRS